MRELIDYILANIPALLTLCTVAFIVLIVLNGGRKLIGIITTVLIVLFTLTVIGVPVREIFDDIFKVNSPTVEETDPSLVYDGESIMKNFIILAEDIFEVVFPSEQNKDVPFLDRVAVVTNDGKVLVISIINGFSNFRKTVQSFFRGEDILPNLI